MIRLLTVAFFVLAFAKAYSQQTTATASTTTLLYSHPASKTVEQFFVDFHKQDTTALRSMFTAGAVLNSMTITGKNRQSSAMPVEVFLEVIANIPTSITWEEKLTNVNTIANDDVASVHADYEFITNGKISHIGRNVFTLIFIDDSWKITQITDTRIL